MWIASDLVEFVDAPEINVRKNISKILLLLIITGFKEKEGEEKIFYAICCCYYFAAIGATWQLYLDLHLSW
jgi:hypothetical protein